jgi:competence protein ComEA
MTTGRVSRFWVSVTIALVAIIAAGAFFAWSRYCPVAAIEISLAEPPEYTGAIYVGEAVAAPGSYPYRSTDTIADLLRAAGGASENASLELRVLTAVAEPQRVDINRAEAWLLVALPGIGQTLAERIVDYRQKNGPFHNTSELMQVAGIGESIFDKVKDKVTVGAD